MANADVPLKWRPGLRRVLAAEDLRRGRRDDGIAKVDHWEAVWSEKAPEATSWYQRTPDVSLRLVDGFLRELGHGVVDVGAGASVFVDGLLDRGVGPVTVVDIADAALERTRSRLGVRAKAVRFVVGDVLDGVPGGPYGLWHDRAVFHFLVDRSDRARYAEVVRACVVPGGYVVVATFAPDGPEMCSGLPVMRHDGPSIARELGDGFELLDEVPEVHVTPWGSEQRFRYAVLRRI